jgi:hypothetical protein
MVFTRVDLDEVALAEAMRQLAELPCYPIRLCPVMS